MEYLGLVLDFGPSFSEQPYCGTVPMERAGMRTMWKMLTRRRLQILVPGDSLRSSPYGGYLNDRERVTNGSMSIEMSLAHQTALDEG